MKAKLDVDHEALGDDKARFFYLYGNLDSKIQCAPIPQSSLPGMPFTLELNRDRPPAERHRSDVRMIG